MITEAGTSCGRKKEPGITGMLLSYHSDQCVDWQWEEIITEVSPVEKNAETLKSDMKDMPQMTEEVTMEITTQATVVIQDILEEDTQATQEHVAYETVTDHNKVIDMNIYKMNTSDNANYTNCSWKVIVLTLVLYYSHSDSY